jgi:PAS domain S-box-containing protein
MERIKDRERESDHDVERVEKTMAAKGRSTRAGRKPATPVREVAKQIRRRGEEPAVGSDVALRESLRQLDDLYNNAPCGYHSLDENGVFVQINDTELTWLGYERDEILGKKRFTDLITPESRKIFQENFPRFIDRGWVKDLEFEMVCKNGNAMPVLLSATSIKDEKGTFVMSRSTIYDMTERREAQERISQLNRIYRLLIKINEAIVHLRDPDELYRQVCRIAIEEGGFVMAWVGLVDPSSHTVRPVAHHGMDEAYLSRIRIAVDAEPEGMGPTGISVREGRCDICNDFEMDPRMIPWREEALKRGYRSSAAFPMKVRGETFGALTLYAPKKFFFSEEEIRLLQQLTDDVSFAVEFMEQEAQRRQAELELKNYRTHLEELVRERTGELEISNERLQAQIREQRRTQEELRRSEDRYRELAGELARSNRELELFAYTASHDLREPLRKITAFGDRLKTQCSTMLDEKGNDYLARMVNASLRMMSLIDGLLRLSRASTKIASFRRVSLAQVIRDVQGDLEVRLEETGGAIEVGSLPVIEADPLGMRQLFQNLISNALKFCTARPRITIECRAMNEHSHEIEVRDNGIGFEEKYLQVIFQPFQQLHGRGAFEGIGMGLAICERIVSRHRGTITAKSVPGAGSSFIITLPAIQDGSPDRRANPPL